ncbi:NAD(P)-dependent oxidoreductase [Massilia sp. TS11]|uniref:NAD-dependent epimerase/dehydratase family protein n=1 Tax=Massilia sp. TS11 TaxID=2908003 RepID=UPI001ED9ECAC|nr:NAD-dependent epimerase/dehydratase family protein [Massilia sp. TS11]MCG2586641.1 NAD-dependent epimerase/dehydratase family protein [Massilia sp. TS11]
MSTFAALMPMPLPPSDLDASCDLVGAPAWEKLRGKRVFLTGGTGFIGKWLLATLLRANDRLALGCALIVLTRDPAAFRAAHPELAGAPSVQLLAGDVRDFAFPAESIDYVIHAAADVVAPSDPLSTLAVAIEGTRRVLDLAVARGARDVLFLSSGAVYGRQPPELDAVPESYAGAPDPAAANAAYGEGKRVAELLCHQYAAQHGLAVRIARCFAFVGPYLALDRQFAVGNFIRDALAGQDIVIQGDGRPYRSYLYASDLSGWLWALLLRGPAGAVVNVGGDEALSIAELAARVVQVLQAPSRVQVLRAPGPGPAERYVPDIRQLRALLDLPAPIPLDVGIARTAAWHLSQKGKP